MTCPSTKSDLAHADQTAKLLMNTKATKCEPFQKPELEKLSQADLESIYCGYLVGIKNIDLEQLKEFEKYVNDIDTKLAISEKIMPKIFNALVTKLKLNIC